MQRDPTIHIKRSDLIKIISEIGITRQSSPISTVDKIFEAAQPYQLRTRYLLAGNAATRKKLSRTIEAENPIVSKFNKILDATRRKLNHKGITTIDVKHRDYLQLKEVAKIAYDFAEEFDIVPRDEGYYEFCIIGIKMMGRKYSLNKFKSYRERISVQFQAKVDVLKDPDPEATKKFYYVWKECMIEYSDFEYEIDITEYEKYVNFVDARKKADEYEAEYNDWIKAQFEGLSFLGVVPELSQLGTDKSLDRYERYLKNESFDTGEETLSSKEEDYLKKIKRKN